MAKKYKENTTLTSVRYPDDLLKWIKQKASSDDRTLTGQLVHIARKAKELGV